MGAYCMNIIREKKNHIFPCIPQLFLPHVRELIASICFACLLCSLHAVVIISLKCLNIMCILGRPIINVHAKNSQGSPLVLFFARTYVVLHKFAGSRVLGKRDK